MENLMDDNFEEFVNKAAKPVLLDVYTSWCPPCKMLSPAIEKVAEDYADKIIVAKMDLDACPKTGDRFGVDRIPTVMLFRGGEVLGTFIGFKPEEDIKAWVDSLI
ncbi:MAG: thioredoxin [Candidatus Paceibacterota bacterium]